jgi:16S rRNA (cytosine1402-N4)-methyltransferase
LDSPHRPALVSEVVELLSDRSVVIDATVGAGGHAEALLRSGVSTVVGVDRDPAALEMAASRLAEFGDRFRAVLSPFSRLAEAAATAGVERAGGVLFDLGVSSMQLEGPARGFGYRISGPLDMRMNQRGDDTDHTAADVANTFREEDLVRVLVEFGEERFARRIARAIVRARQRRRIDTTEELAGIVAGAVPRRRGGPHPARRTFQALRIEVNRELEELAASLPQAASLLEPGGRLVVLSYHSLEDRIVKRFIASQSDLSSLTRKPVTASAPEAVSNPRSRSAKLRAAERLVPEAA